MLGVGGGDRTVAELRSLPTDVALATILIVRLAPLASAPR